MGISRKMILRGNTASFSLLVLVFAGVSSDGKYWWMNSGAFNGGQGQGGGYVQQEDSSGGYQQQQDYVDNSLQGNQGITLPATQGLLSQAQPAQQTVSGSCPSVSPPPLSSCGGRTSNCWSPGQPDTDCIGDALCCFDGCSNVCQGAGSRSPAPPPNPRPAQAQQQFQPPSKQQQNNQYQPAQQQQQESYPSPQGQPDKNVDPWPQQQQQQQRPRQPANVIQQSQLQVSGNFVPADQKPFITCPSAMKCVPRINCDLGGTMRDQVFRYTPAQEASRVPLIPCFNQARGNSIDTCCRDPNYKDPWPDMQGGGATNNNNQGIVPRAQQNKKNPKKKSKDKKKQDYAWLNDNKMFG